jgi:hypothetical protein
MRQSWGNVAIRMKGRPLGFRDCSMSLSAERQLASATSLALAMARKSPFINAAVSAALRSSQQRATASSFLV